MNTLQYCLCMASKLRLKPKVFYCLHVAYHILLHWLTQVHAGYFHILHWLTHTCSVLHILHWLTQGIAYMQRIPYTALANTTYMQCVSHILHWQGIITLHTMCSPTNNTNISIHMCLHIGIFQDISIRNSSVLHVYPPDNPKSTVYYVMKTLKCLLPNVVVKVRAGVQISCMIVQLVCTCCAS